MISEIYQWYNIILSIMVNHIGIYHVVAIKTVMQKNWIKSKSAPNCIYLHQRGLRVRNSSGCTMILHWKQCTCSIQTLINPPSSGSRIHTCVADGVDTGINVRNDDCLWKKDRSDHEGWWVSCLMWIITIRSHNSSAHNVQHNRTSAKLSACSNLAHNGSSVYLKA